MKSTSQTSGAGAPAKDTKPAEKSTSQSDRSASNAKPSSKRSAQQGEKKSTPH